MTKTLAMVCCTVLFGAAIEASAQVGASPSAQTVEWKGFYVGGTAGLALNSANANTTTVFSSTGYFATTSPPAIALAGAQHLTPRGFAGAGLVGYNMFTVGPLRVGAEADFGAMDASSSTTDFGIYPCCAPTAFIVTQSVNTEWLFTARPRVGIMLGNLLVFGTAGLAVTHVNYDTLFADTFATARESASVAETVTGWTIGGGFEHHLRGRWQVTGQYLYADFGDVSTKSANFRAFTPPIPFPTNVFTHSSDLRAFVVRGGLLYRFGG